MRNIYKFIFGIFIFSTQQVAAQYTAGNLTFLRIGDGSTTLSSDAAKLDVLEMKTDNTLTGTSIVNTLSLPTSTSGTNKRITQSGSASSEGELTLSGDGKYIVCVGYDAATGTGSIKDGTDNGVIARIDASRNYNTSTSFSRSSSYKSNNFRSGTTNDGTGYWTSGTGSGTTGGVWYIPHGNNGSSMIKLSTTSTNTRVVNMYNGQLYVSTGSGSICLGKVGTGLPTSGTSNTITNLPNNFPADGSDTYDYHSYVMFDTNGDNLPDLLYIVDYRSNAANGIQKWSLISGTWTSRGTITGSTTLAPRGITGRINCSGGIDLYFTATAGNPTSTRPTKIYFYQDNTTPTTTLTSKTISSNATLLYTAGTKYCLSGICFAPTQGDVSHTTGTNNLAGGEYRTIRITGGTTTLSGNVNFSDSFYIANGATLICNNFTISGNRFILAAGATLKMGSKDGITSTAGKGNLQLRVNTCDNLNTAANYEYTSSTGAKMGDMLPPTVNNLTLANNRADTASGPITVNGILSIPNAIDTLDMGINALALGGSASVSGLGIIRTQNTSAAPIPANKTWAPRVEYNGGAQNIVQGAYSSLIASGSGTSTKTLTVGNSSVTDSFQLKTNTTLALGNFYLTLKSTSTKTARVGTIGAGAALTYSGIGRFVVERYFDKRRSWRLMTAPVTVDAVKSVYNSWQTGGATAEGSGIFVTGANPSTTNGLDVSPKNTSSLKTFNVSTQALVAVTNTKTQLISGTTGATGTPDNIGFFNFVRGDRTDPDYLTLYDSSITTIRDTGKIQINTLTFTASAIASKKTLIGNPYASPIDFDKVNLTNVYKHFFAWDPKLNDVGGYILIENDDNSVPYSITPASPGGQNQYIQSSQAVFVETIANAAASVVFNESNKSSTNNPALFRPAAIIPTFRTNLYLANADTTILADGNLVKFDASFDNAINGYDVNKPGNTNEMIAWARANKNLILERRQPLTVMDTLFLSLSKTTQRNYKLEFVPNGLTATGLEGILIDKYTNKEQPINLSGITEVNFSINANVLSQSTDRFYIVFRAVAAPLPVKFVTVNAKNINKLNVVEWVIENEINISKYIVEVSNDGINFEKLTTVSSGAHVYLTIDSQLHNIPVYYRIKAINNNGHLEYSKIVKVSEVKENTSLNIYPNPLTGKEINIKFTNTDFIGKEFTVSIFNSVGQQMFNSNYVWNNTVDVHKVVLPKYFASGLYQLSVKNKLTNRKYSTTLIID